MSGGFFDKLVNSLKSSGHENPEKRAEDIVTTAMVGKPSQALNEKQTSQAAEMYKQDPVAADRSLANNNVPNKANFEEAVFKKEYEEKQAKDPQQQVADARIVINNLKPIEGKSLLDIAKSLAFDGGALSERVNMEMSGRFTPGQNASADKIAQVYKENIENKGKNEIV